MIFASQLLDMGSLLQGLMTKTLLITHLLVVTEAAALAVDARPHFTSQEAASTQPFRPQPPGIPERRLSGGTR
ncbi:MAG: hypothetical protein F6K11_08235 [Leptolyngbya sp. SIO3F4]|nr:hypothetical protein [Leptolyngbya sp. SIO3F4]